MTDGNVKIGGKGELSDVFQGNNSEATDKKIILDHKQP